MACLTDVEIQAIVDGEASEERRGHEVTCERCRARVDERRRDMSAIGALMEGHGHPSPAFAMRLRQAAHAPHVVRGSTVLRPLAGSLRWGRAGWVSAIATAAAIALVVFAILPRFGAPTTLSANEILGRSLQTLSSAKGVELLEYEVAVGGMSHSPVVIRQLIDRDNPGRYRIASYGPDGEIHTAISQDPLTQRRAQLVRVDGVNYIVRVGAIPGPVLSLPQMAQALVETSISMMQAKSDQQLTVEDGPEGRRYVIDVPPVTPANPATTLDIFGARAVISGQDFRILQFDATGMLLKQPFSVSVKLRTHEFIGGPAPSFEIETGPEDVVLEGAAGDDPATELLTTILRELRPARGK
jgi:hypothetical protein